jgi:hypothetical protein
MGRRSRARERAAASVAAPPPPAAARDRGRRRWARLLNPFGRRATRTRARAAAAVFGVAAVLVGLVGELTGEPAWYRSAALLAVLALVWGLASTVLGGGDRSG